MGQPRPIFHLFSVLQTNKTIFTTNQSEKMSCPPVYSAGIRTQDRHNMSLLQ